MHMMGVVDSRGITVVQTMSRFFVNMNQYNSEMIWLVAMHDCSIRNKYNQPVVIN